MPWRVRLLALWAAVKQAVTGQHVYFSTGCMAGEHDWCKSMIGLNGKKNGGLSKFSNAPCICWCHR